MKGARISCTLLDFADLLGVAQRVHDDEGQKLHAVHWADQRVCSGTHAQVVIAGDYVVNRSSAGGSELFSGFGQAPETSGRTRSFRRPGLLIAISAIAVEDCHLPFTAGRRGLGGNSGLPKPAKQPGFRRTHMLYTVAK